MCPLQSSRNTLRPDFCWGFATAAAKVEGAWSKDIKGESIWDEFCHEAGRVKGKSTNEEIVRSYDL